MNNLTQVNLNDALLQPYCVILFSPIWCYPGNVMKEYIEKESIPCFLVDTDAEIKLCKRYKVSKVPSVIFMKRGRTYKRYEGKLEQQEFDTLRDDFYKHLKRCHLLDE